VYVAGLGDNRIATVDTAGRVELTEVPGPNHVYVTFALSPDGRRLAASTQLSSMILGFDVSGGTPRQVGAATVAPFGYQIAYAPDGGSVWTGNQRSGMATQVDALSWRVLGTVSGPGFQEPHGVAISPDGGTVFVSSHGVADTAQGGHRPQPADTAHGGMHSDVPRGTGTVTIIDAATRTVRDVIAVGQNATGIGIGGRP
jgi:DNA-binding beta-propeller fold protein YncE